jgi:hypothetical protein
MKNQYFGDINDYRKYGLIRLLSNHGELCVGMCWMLTESDDRTDGKFTDYLAKARTYRQYDEALFDSLKECLSRPEGRYVCNAEDRSMIPRAVYYDAVLAASSGERRRYFEEFERLTQNCDLIFFDPDNGIEIRSKRKGTKDSCKYLYWDELEQAYASGKSVLVYQHFKREKRETTISSLSSEAQRRLGVSQVFAFRTPHVLFLLMSQPAHQAHFQQQAEKIATRWRSQITVEYL